MFHDNRTQRKSGQGWAMTHVLFKCQLEKRNPSINAETLDTMQETMNKIQTLNPDIKKA